MTGSARRFDPRAPRTFHRWAVPLGLGLAGLLLALGGDHLQGLARYDREAIRGGELWRLATGHLVHLGWGHLWLNLAALALIGVLLDGLMSFRLWVAAAALSAASIDAGLYFLHPDVEWYVGLSGVLHGLVSTGAVGLSATRSPIGAVLALGVLAKLGWELWLGPLPFSEHAAGPVVTEAHLYGALGGVVAGLLASAVRESPTGGYNRCEPRE